MLDLQNLTLSFLSGEQRLEAFRIVVQLRDHLDPVEYLRRLETQEAAGYQLVGARLDGALVGVMGMRAVHTLARGAHLHVDDLVVDAALRGKGIGAALLRYAHDDARRRGLVSIFLDSRPEVIDFYRAHGFEQHTATLMRVRVQHPA